MVSKQVKQVVKVIWHKAASLSHTDGSIVFARWRQWAPPHLIHGSLDPQVSVSQTASPSVQPFLHRSWQRVPIVYNRPSFSPSKLPIHVGIWTPSNTWFLGLTQIQPPHDISIGSAIFAGLTTVTNRQTDRQTDRPHYSACNNRPHLAGAAMKNKTCSSSSSSRSAQILDSV